MSTMKCADCGESFFEDAAITITDLADDMYDRGVVAIITLACPACAGTELEDTDEEPTW